MTADVKCQMPDVEDDYQVPPMDAQVQDILECFDFASMAYTMRFLGWKLAGIDERTGEPGFFAREDDLRSLARRLLNEVAVDSHPFATRQTCGFVAQKRNGYLTLYFVAEYWENTP